MFQSIFMLQIWFTKFYLKTYIMNTPDGKNNYNTVTKYIDELDIHLSRALKSNAKT